jgi:hypothetical protein
VIVQEIAAAHMIGAFKHVDHCVCNPGFFRDSLATYLAAGRAHPAVHATQAKRACWSVLSLHYRLMTSTRIPYNYNIEQSEA